MKRILCFALAALMLASLAACGEKKPDSTESVTEKVTEAAPVTEEPTTEATAEPTTARHEVISLDFINDFDKTASIEEQEIYNKDGVTVTAKKLVYDTVSGPQIVLAVKNDTDKTLMIQNAYTVVNGFMMKPVLDITAKPGKTVEEPMSLPYLGLAMASIHSLREIEFSLRILDSTTYGVMDTTPEVRFNLTGGTKSEPTFDEDGQVVYDGKECKIVLKGIKRDTLFDSANVVEVYMMNKTDKTIGIRNSKLTVNGYEITTAMETAILGEKRAVDVIELYDNELDEYGVTALDTVDVAFEINDYETWDKLATTDTVSVEVPEIAAEEETATETATEK